VCTTTTYADTGANGWTIVSQLAGAYEE